MTNLNQKDENKLKKKISKIFKDNDKSIDEFDIESEIDRKISYSENLTALKKKLDNYLGSDLKSKVESVKQKQAKEENEQLNLILQQERATDEKLDADIEQLRNSEIKVIKKYDVPTDFIKSVARGHHKAFIFLGSQGLGKTYLTKQVLAKENVEIANSVGVTSPMSLYQFLYENNSKNKVIVFDDVSGLIDNANAFSILLGALWGGVVCWNSTSEKLSVPKKFIFESRVIFICNELKGSNVDIFESRCLSHTLELTREDKISMMYLIAKGEHKNLDQKERKSIVDFIKANTDNSVKFDLRTQQKAENLYIYKQDRWKALTKKILKKDDNFEKMRDCLQNNNTIKEAETQFRNETGLSRITFYRYKKILT